MSPPPLRFSDQLFITYSGKRVIARVTVHLRRASWARFPPCPHERHLLCQKIITLHSLLEPLPSLCLTVAEPELRRREQRLFIEGLTGVHTNEVKALKGAESRAWTARVHAQR